jgi:hypothetical protein
MLPGVHAFARVDHAAVVTEARNVDTEYQRVIRRAHEFTCHRCFD